MWIVAALTMVTVLAPGLDSREMEPAGGVGGWHRPASHLHAQQVQEPRIWLDRGVDPVLEMGDRVRIYYRTNSDAYVAILQIDTDGTTRILYPRSPTENHYARADRDYRLLFPRSAYWNVDDRPGIGYFFVVTSPAPLDLSDFQYSYFEGGWDLSAVGSTVYSDPYVAMDDYVARMIPDWETVDYGLDFISYNVGGLHEFPRFLCYQCHGFRPYGTWNPYRYTCVDFRVVIYDDPYFYPSYRYPANRVVMVGPRNRAGPRFGFKERGAGDPGTPVRVVRRGRGDDSPSMADGPRTGQPVGRGRVAPPPVAPRPTRTRSPEPSGPTDAPRVTRGDGRAAPPAVSDREPRRPTLERRSAAPEQGTRPPSRTIKPRSAQPSRAPQADRPSRRRPDQPRAGSPSRAPSQRPSTRRPPEESRGSSSTRPAPRARPRTPPADRRSRQTAAETST